MVLMMGFKKTLFLYVFGSPCHLGGTKPCGVSCLVISSNKVLLIQLCVCHVFQQDIDLTFVLLC
jgi:hypothetical protein